MPNFFKWLLFISSYAPLYLLLAVNNYKFDNTPFDNYKKILENAQQLTFWIIIIALFMISVLSVSYFRFISLNSKTKISGLTPLNQSVLNYFITYVIPLTNMNINSVNSLIVNALLFLIIGIVYVKSDFVYLNILLIILGFTIYNDSIGNVIITNYKKDDLISFEKSGNSLKCRKVVRGVYLIKR